MRDATVTCVTASKRLFDAPIQFSDIAIETVLDEAFDTRENLPDLPGVFLRATAFTYLICRG